MRSEWTSFWLPPRRHTPTSGASEATIDEAERKLGVRLPATLRRMLLVQNGGRLRGRHAHTEGFHEIRGINVGPISLDRNNPWWLDDEYWQPLAPLELLVPLAGDGHSDLCLDYRSQGRTSEPAVASVSCDAEKEALIAPSFDDFLHQIEPIEAGLVLQDTSLSAAEIAERVAKVCGTEPRELEQDTWRVASERGSFFIRENRLPVDGQWHCIPEHPEDGVALLLEAEHTFEQMSTDLRSIAEDAGLL